MKIPKPKYRVGDSVVVKYYQTYRMFSVVEATLDEKIGWRYWTSEPRVGHILESEIVMKV